MATERELKTIQEERLYDILKAISAKTHEERLVILEDQFERAQSGMTKEEISFVKERVERRNKSS